MSTNPKRNKRKHVASTTDYDKPNLSTKRTKITDNEDYLPKPNSRPKKPLPTKQTQKQAKGEPEIIIARTETRLRRYRSSAPQSYLQIKDRALTQRLTVMGRERYGSDDIPEEKVSIAGSTGNLYTVIIGLVPECDCPHAKKGNQCKHIIYVMLRVLKAREDIAYQLALTSSELRTVFHHAPPIPSATVDPSSSSSNDEDTNRKPIEGECPICYTEFEPDLEAIVYCRHACGNNVHKECMKSWAAASSGCATCPMCRSVWSAMDISSTKTGEIDLSAAETEDGYRNVAAQLGISRQRDYSSYHQPWVSRRFGRDYRYSRY